MADCCRLPGALQRQAAVQTTVLEDKRISASGRALQLPSANTSAIRVVTIEDNLWLVAKDVCTVLGKKSIETNMTLHLRPLDDSEKMRAPNSLAIARNPLLITESGLYKLVMRSDKPQAKPFQDWVTKVAFPAIRKDDAYIQDEERVVTGGNVRG